MVAILMLFTTPVTLVIIIFPQFFIRIIAGPGYEASATILQFYMLAGIFRPMQNQAANLLNSIGKPAFVFVINTVFLGVTLLVNYLCLSSFGFYGPAYGSLITSFLVCITWYYIMRKMVDLSISDVFTHMKDFCKTLFQYTVSFFSKKGKVTE